MFILVIIVCTCVNQSVNSLTIEQIQKTIVSKKVNALKNKSLRNKLHLWNRKFLFLLVIFLFFFLCRVFSLRMLPKRRTFFFFFSSAKSCCLVLILAFIRNFFSIRFLLAG